MIIDRLFSCIDKCDAFDYQCEHDCTIKFEDQLKLCPCMEECPNGCPCPFFDCSQAATTTKSTTTTTAETTITTTKKSTTTPTTTQSSTTSSTTTTITTSTTTTSTTTTSGPIPYEEIFILTFNPRKTEQVKLSISFYPNNVDPKVTSKPVILDSAPTDRKQMCSYTSQGRMFLMGGFYNEFQNMEVVKNAVIRLDDLPFAFRGGRCDVFRETRILACAPNSHPHQCYEFELGDDEPQVSTTKSNHLKGGLVIYKSAPTILREFLLISNSRKVCLVGALSGQTEKYDISTRQWSVINTAASMDGLSQFTSTIINNEIYVFGK